MKNIIFITILTLIVNFSKSQQQIIFNDSRSETYLVKEEAGGKNSHLNQIIQLLARGNNKPVHLTKFYFGYKQKSRILKKNNSLEIIVELEDIGFTGDIKYKGFLMSEFLFPNNVDFKIDLLNRKGLLLKSFEFTDIQINEDNLTIANFLENDSLNTNSYKLEIKNKNFFYNNINWKLIKNKSDLIDEYYILDNQFKIAFMELETIKMNRLEKLYDYKNIVDKNDLLIKSITKKDFINQLKLYEYDPIFFDDKLTNLINLNNQLKNEIYYSIEHLYEIYYNRGLEMLSFGKIDAAINDFNNSINNNLFFAPAHYQIAKIDYNKKKYDSAIEGVINILNKLKPDPQIYNHTIDLANAIYNSLINEAKQNNSQQKYEQSLVILENAKKLCQSATGIICTNELDNETNNAIIGKYNKYLSEIEKYIYSKKYTEAENNIQTIIFFYKSNSNILNVSELNSVIELLHNSYVNDAKAELSKSNCDISIEFLNKAVQICKTNNNISCNNEIDHIYKNSYICRYNKLLQNAQIQLKSLKLDEAENIINQAESFRAEKNLDIIPFQNEIYTNIFKVKFENYIKSAISNNENKNYSFVIVDLEKAKAIAEKFNFNFTKNFNDMLVNAVINKTIEYCNIGNTEAEKNNLKQARESYKEAKFLQEKYNLQSNTNLNKELEILKGKIFSQECKNAQNEYNKQLEIVDDYIRKKQFIDAERAIEKSIKIAQSYPDCDIDLENSNKKRSEIIPAFTYQKLFQNIEQLLKEGSYKELYIKYQELEMYYYEFSVERFGINHLKINDFIVKCNSEFVKYSISHFIEKKEINSALQFLKELKTRNYPPKWCSSEQKLLGEKLAINDKKNGKIDYKSSIFLITENHKWYKDLKKSYIKTWKSLK